MRKLLFAAYSMDIGGIEKALLNLINELSNLNYDITLVLEKKQGIFLNEINPEIKIIEYRPSESKNILKRKIINVLKRVKFILKYKNRFDFSASFATYSLPGAFISRMSSKNNCLWVHTNYLTFFKDNTENFKNFFESIGYNKFKNILFVSETAKNDFLKIFPNTKEKVGVSKNLIDYKKIKMLAEEKVIIKKEENTTIFLNVGRHEEKSKRLSRLIEACKMLKDDKLKFKVLFVGDGPDSLQYKKLVKEKGLNQNIEFLGIKENPYPYFKKSDCVILTSEYEGYPVVFLESFTLNKPIITTRVSDYKDVEGKFGYVTEKKSRDIYEKMKCFIENGYKIKKEFNPKEYNKEIISKLEKIF